MSRITTGWLARHTPQGPGGRQAALIDGQDIDGFRYSVGDHRGRAQVRYETPFGG